MTKPISDKAREALVAAKRAEELAKEHERERSECILYRICPECGGKLNMDDTAHLVDTEWACDSCGLCSWLL